MTKRKSFEFREWGCRVPPFPKRWERMGHPLAPTVDTSAGNGEFELGELCLCIHQTRADGLEAGLEEAQVLGLVHHAQAFHVLALRINLDYGFGDHVHV